MAMANSIAHPLAKPGYGKRSAPDQSPRNRADFAHLKPREATIAAFIDRLPEGAAMDAKTLAAHLPSYGQAACRTALRRLSEAGHLRRVKEHVKSEDGSAHWVTRTYFSRTPRDDAWWGPVLTGDAPAPPKPPRPTRSTAYTALASAARTDPRMTLSAADCEALEPLAMQWLERGADERTIVRALTAGLPPEVHHAAAFARRRLTDKLPPEPEPLPAPAPLRILECTVCATPGRPEALPGGVCRECRGEARSPEPPGPSRAAVRTRVEQLRAINRTRKRSRV
ncbi:hypothetical protein ACFY2W_17330 [Streptomyces sp. NPDC001262]|uniref:hypothetical protein n=1 Tax=Streptomyces sp. NPDC001262 TaxID=3364552 RepID=UPI0036B2D6CA